MKYTIFTIFLSFLTFNTIAADDSSNSCFPVANEMTCQLVGGTYDEKAKLCCLDTKKPSQGAIFTGFFLIP